MKYVIVGCGRVGAALAEALDNDGHEVLIIDTSTRAFDRLSGEFKGQAIRGDGTDEDVLRRAGAERADVLLALTEGDNRNVMAAQLATEKLSIDRVVAKINDPVRAAAYAELGIATVCRTTMLTDALLGHLGLRQSGMPAVIAAVPHVHEDAEPEASRGLAGGAEAVPGRTTAPAPATTERRS